MGKTLIVFDSPNENDSAQWKQLMSGTGGNGKEIGNGDEVRVCRGKDFRDGCAWQFERIINKILSIIKDNDSQEYAVLLHTQDEDEITELRNQINLPPDVKITFEKFSTAVSPIIDFKKYIVPFCVNPCEESFNNLWAKIHKETHEDMVSQVRNLRSEILSPFVTLHFALQASLDENYELKDNHLIQSAICRSCCTEIAELNAERGVLHDFLKRVDSEDKSKICQAFDNLKKAISSQDGLLAEICSEDKDCLKRDAIKKLISGDSIKQIEIFSKMLDKVVTQIEDVKS